MDAEEVDFGAVEDLVADAELDGDGGDEGDEFVAGGGANTDMPFFPPAGCFESPVVLPLAVASLPSQEPLTN